MVEPPKLNVKTYNKRVVTKKREGGGDFRAIKLPQIAPENAGNRISEALKLKIIRGSMPPDPPWGLPPLAGVYPNPPSSNPGSTPGLSPDYLSSKFLDRKGHRGQTSYPTATHKTI